MATIMEDLGVVTSQSPSATVMAGSGNVSLFLANTGSCGSNETEDYQEFYETAQFVSGLIVYPLLCVVGITGNSLALIVLSHKDMATSTNVYLFGKNTYF